MPSCANLTGKGSSVVKYALAKSREVKRANGEKTTEGYYMGRGAPSAWHGTGSTALGLKNDKPMDAETLEKLLDGKLPNGTDLSGRGNKTVHRMGVDLTFSAPKSVSIVGLVGGDERVMKAHDKAVAAANLYIEKNMIFSQMGKGGINKVMTGKLVAASFRHHDSRAIDGMADPQIHTHNIVLNMTQRPDGTWAKMKLDFGYNNQKRDLCEEIYQTTLANEMTKLGYQIEKNEKSWEIKGVSRSEIEFFSRRKAAIDEYLHENGSSREGSSETERRAANLATRNEKSQLNEHEQGREWRARAREAGIDVEALIKQAKLDLKDPTKKIDPIAESDAAVQYAADHHFERESVVTDELLKQTALEYGLGKITVEDIEGAIDRRAGGLVFVGRNDRDDEIWTNNTTLAREAWILEYEKETRGSMDPIKTSTEIDRVIEQWQERKGIEFKIEDFKYTDGQRDSIKMALTSKDQIFGIVGVAGGGKTTATEAIADEFRQAGYHIVGLGPDAATAEALKTARCDETKTVDSLLFSKPPTDGKPRLYVLDEAGKLQTRNLAKLIDRLKAEGSRLLLIGDPRQMSAIEAGMPFDLLLKEGMTHSTISEVQRQKLEEDREMVTAFSEGDNEKGVSMASKYIKSVSKGDIEATIAKKYCDMSVEERQKVVLLSGMNTTRRGINECVRKGLKEKGELGEDDITLKQLEIADMTHAKMRVSRYYKEGMIIIFPERMARGQRQKQWTVLGRDGDDILLQSGDEKKVWTPPLHDKNSEFQVYNQRAMSFGLNDKILFRSTDRDLGVMNNEGGVITRIENGVIEVLTDTGKSVRLGKERAHIIDYGYCRTVHSSQGLTVERVIIAGEGAKVATARLAYVGLSRHKFWVEVITDNAEKLMKNMLNIAEKENAMPHRRSVVDEISKARQTVKAEPENTEEEATEIPRGAPDQAKTKGQGRGRTIEPTLSEIFEGRTKVPPARRPRVKDNTLTL